MGLGATVGIWWDDGGTTDGRRGVAAATEDISTLWSASPSCNEISSSSSDCVIFARFGRWRHELSLFDASAWLCIEVLRVQLRLPRLGKTENPEQRKTQTRSITKALP